MRSGLPPGFLAAVQLLGACHQVVAVDPIEGGQAVVLVAARGELPVEVVALDRTASGWPAISIEASDELYAATFSCDVARLGMVPGLQAIVDVSDARLPPPSRVLRSVGSGWEPVTLVPTALQQGLDRVDIPVGARCDAVGARFEATALTQPRDERGSPAFVFALDRDRALVGDLDQSLYVVERSGSIESVGRRAPQPIPLARHRVRGGVRAPSGGFWLVMDDGNLWSWSGDLQADAEALTYTNTFGTFRRVSLAVSAPGEVPELFLVGWESVNAGPGMGGGGRRIFARYAEGRWTELERAVHEGIYLPSVARAGPGRAMSIGTSTVGKNTVTRYENGELRTDVLAFEPVAGTVTGPSAVLWHPTLGWIVAGDEGSLRREVQGQWTLFPRTFEVYFIRMLFASGDGFVYGGGSGINFDSSNFGEFQPSIGLCGTPRQYTLYAATHQAPLDEDLRVVLHVNNFNGPLNITLLRRTRAPRSCSELSP